MDIKLTRMEISDLCRELALLLRSGVGESDGLALLAEQEDQEDIRKLLASMADAMDMGDPLAKAVRESNAFPSYVYGLLEVGGISGKTEEALLALADYYEERERMDRRIRGALLYPSVLLVLMLVVIVVLLAKVLPVFNSVYASLGGQLTGVAGGLLGVGRVLDTILPVLCVLLGVVVIGLALFSASGTVREKITGAWARRYGDRGISRKMNDARFAQAMAMGLKSGLQLEESLDLSANLLEGVPSAVKRCRDCRDLLFDGRNLADALKEAGVLPAASCRVLALGLRSGCGDEAMGQIADRLAEDADTALETMTSRIEPTLVLVTSLMVGAILLSVMLPLMNIMTAIG